MNEIPRRLPTGPPWPLELLAELHGDALDPEPAAELRARVAADPQAAALLRALDATEADLARLAAAPPVRMPDRVAARLDHALAALRTPPLAPGDAEAPLLAPFPGSRPEIGSRLATTAGAATTADLARDLATARERRRRRAAGLAVLATAAAAAVIFGIAIPGSHTAGTPVAAGPAGPAGPPAGSTLALSEAEIPTALDPALRAPDLGPLADRAALADCLHANGVDPATGVLGARQVRLVGQPGVLLVLAADTANRYRLLVVGAGCSAGNPATLADTVVDR